MHQIKNAHKALQENMINQLKQLISQNQFDNVVKKFTPKEMFQKEQIAKFYQLF